MRKAHADAESASGGPKSRSREGGHGAPGTADAIRPVQTRNNAMLLERG
jgi:hypothetical protein